MCKIRFTKKQSHQFAGNTRSLINNTVLSFGVKGLSMIVVLASTPAYLAYFSNDEILGLWFTLISILTWILTCDMGIGNGLRNELVPALVTNNHDEAKRLVSSSYAFLCAIGGMVFLLTLFISHFIDWSVVFNIDSGSVADDELRCAITAILVSVVLQLILRIITSILYAMQKAYVPGLLSLITNSALLVYCLIAVIFGINGSLFDLACVYAVAVNVPLLLASFVVFHQYKFLAPSFSSIEKSYANRIVRLGLAFLWLQIMMLILNNSSSYLITLLIGNAQVVQYQIYYRIFSIALSVSMLCTTPVWSAATKAKTEGDYTWLWKIYKLFIILSIIATVLQLLLCIPLQFVFDIWLGSKTIQVDFVAALVFALYGSVLVWSNVLATFANGLQELRIQTIFLTLGAVINIPIAVALSGQFESYLAIVVANIISYVPYIIAQFIWMTGYLRAMAK